MLDYLGLLADLQQRFHVSIPADLSVPVPTCGEWTARELVAHVANVHLWAAGMAHGENRPEVDLSGHADLAAFYDTAATTLRANLAELGPDAPARTLNGPGPASFWHRRQVHETLVHLYDLRTPLAMEVDGVPAEVWADGVDEVVTMFYPRQVRLGRTGAVPHPVEFVASDVGTAWTLGDGAPVATVTAPAQDLDLFLWGRIGLGRVAVSGDDAVIAETLQTAFTP